VLTSAENGLSAAYNDGLVPAIKTLFYSVGWTIKSIFTFVENLVLTLIKRLIPNTAIAIKNSFVWGFSKLRNALSATTSKMQSAGSWLLQIAMTSLKLFLKTILIILREAYFYSATFLSKLAVWTNHFFKFLLAGITAVTVALYNSILLITTGVTDSAGNAVTRVGSATPHGTLSVVRFALLPILTVVRIIRFTTESLTKLIKLTWLIFKTVAYTPVMLYKLILGTIRLAIKGLSSTIYFILNRIAIPSAQKTFLGIRIAGKTTLKISYQTFVLIITKIIPTQTHTDYYADDPG